MTISVRGGITQRHHRHLPNPGMPPLFLQNYPLGGGALQINKVISLLTARLGDFWGAQQGTGPWAVAPAVWHLTHNVSFNLLSSLKRSGLWPHFTYRKTKAERHEENCSGVQNGATRFLLQA